MGSWTTLAAHLDCDQFVMCNALWQGMKLKLVELEYEIMRREKENRENKRKKKEKKMRIPTRMGNLGI